MAHANSWRTVSDPRPATPPVYGAEVDPDARILDLEMQVERLLGELAHFGRHLPSCQIVDPDECECCFRQVANRPLWKGVGDSENIDTALEWWSDDAVAERRGK